MSKTLSKQSGSAGGGTTSRVSLARKQYRILDESTRNRRNRQQLEQLERDNFHDDPHANLVMHKKAPKFEDINSKSSLTSPTTSGRRYNLPRSRQLTLNALIEEDSRSPAPNYLSLMTRQMSKKKKNTANSNTPNIYLPNIETSVIKRHFCNVCGFKGNYTCIVCGLRFCSTGCQVTHVETRCLKWSG